MSNPVKLLKELLPNVVAPVVIRVVSVQPVLRSKTGSYYVTFHVIDEKGTRARMIFYSRGKLECDRMEKRLPVNGVFRIERFTVKFVPEQYRIGECQYNIQLTNFTILTDVSETEDDVIPRITFSYIPIARIADYPVGTTISCLAYVQNVGELVLDEHVSPPKVTREIKLADEFNDEISITLWNEYARNCTLKERNIIALQRAKISSYQGLSLQANSGTTVVVEPKDVDLTKLVKIVEGKKRKFDDGASTSSSNGDEDTGKKSRGEGTEGGEVNV